MSFMPIIPLVKGFRNQRYFNGRGREVTKDVYAMVDAMAEVLKSAPPEKGKKITNIYVEMVDGQPKVRVEFED